MTGRGKLYFENCFVDLDACLVETGEERRKLDPKAADLLAVLAERSGEVVSRDDILEKLWPGLVVGDDALPQAVSRLRKALNDTPKAPRYIETIPKRGYCLMAAPRMPAPRSVKRDRRFFANRAAVALAFLAAIAFGGLIVWSPDPESGTAFARDATARGDDRYMQFTRTGNETAISLYEQAISDDPAFAPAQAGLANALVQRVVRWPEDAKGPYPSAPTLTEALASERLRTPLARETLYRAQAFAERAVRLSPDSPNALKALGFVYSAQGKIEEAIRIHQRAVAANAQSWPSLINLGELHLIQGREREALGYFEQAFGVMNNLYHAQPQHIGDWHAALGAEIAARYEGLQDYAAAERWRRRVLEISPLHPGATAGLAQLHTRAGEHDAGRALCLDLVARIGADNECGVFLTAAEAIPNAR